MSAFLRRLPSLRALPARLRLPWDSRMRKDVLLILGAFAVLYTGYAFLELADDVGEGETHRTDMAILMLFREDGNPADAVGPEWLESGVRDITALGSATLLVMVTLFACGFLAFRRQFNGLAVLIASMLGGWAVSISLKDYFARERPDLVELPSFVSYSFPSGHSMMSAVVYLTLGFLLTQFVKPFWFKAYLLVAAGFLTFIVGLSRLFLGVHYPSDVVAGWMAGLAWAGFCLIVAEWLQRRGSIEQEK